MKRSILWTICFFLLLSHAGFAQVMQELLQGDWIVVNMTTADGSTIIDPGMEHITYTMYSFINDMVQMKTMPNWGGYNEPDLKYKLMDSFIISNVVTYKMLNLTKKQTILSHIAITGILGNYTVLRPCKY